MYVGKARAQQELLGMSDRQLEDCGFSKTLLLQGVHTYPWRAEAGANNLAHGAPAAEAAQPTRTRRAIRGAVKELSSYSDRELAELGITRNTIGEAVRYGRPMIDEGHGSYKHAA